MARHTLWRGVPAVLLALALLTGLAAASPSFTAQEITGPSGSRFTGMGMNNLGDVVGYFKDASNRTRAFACLGGTSWQLQTSADMGSSTNYELSINDGRYIVGKMAKDYVTDFYPVVWYTPSSYSFLTVSPLTGEAAPTGINNSNQIALRAIVSNYDSSIITLGVGSTIVEPAGHNSSSVMGIADGGAFVGQAYDNSTYATDGMIGRVNASGALTSLSTFQAFLSTGGTWSSAVNSSGQSVGTATWGPKDGYGNPYSKAYKRDADGTVHDLGVGTGVRSYATDINEKGYVVGATLDASYARTPVLFGSGTVSQPLQPLVKALPAGYTLTEAKAINDKGQILVNAVDPGGVPHTLVLTPEVLIDSFTTPGQLGLWQAILGSENALATVVLDPDDPGRYVCKLVTGSIVGISQQISTPGDPFDFTFQYKLESSSGTLTTSLNGAQLGSLDMSGSPPGQWLTAAFHVADPALLGLYDATVDILYDAPTGSTIYLDDTVFTVVPEPACLALLIPAGLGIRRRRRARGLAARRATC